jgi:hypothetical protein
MQTRFANTKKQWKMEHRISVLFYARKSKKTSKGLVPIYIRITVNGKRLEYSIQRYIDAGQLSARAGRVKGNNDQARPKLLMDIKMMLEGHLNRTVKRWLKSSEVRKILGISPGTLQTLRNNGKIPFSKMGGLTYYDAAEIDRILSASGNHF